MRKVGLMLLLTAFLILGFAIGAPGVPQSGNALVPPSVANWMGTDVLGRDLFGRLALAAARSVAVSVAAWSVAVLIGAAIGTATGMSPRSILSKLTGRIMALIYSTPFMLVLVAIVAVLGPGMLNAYLALLMFAWAAPARHADEMVRRLREATHVRASFALGFRPSQIVRVVLLPAVLPTVAVAALPALPDLLVLDVLLSFVGLGAQPPIPTLGGMLLDGLSYGAVAWWLVAFPLTVLVCICLSVRALHFDTSRASSVNRYRHAARTAF